ncbi:hypothetical protein ACWOFH_02540 [Aerococcus christensenii]
MSYKKLSLLFPLVLFTLAACGQHKQSAAEESKAPVIQPVVEDNGKKSTQEHSPSKKEKKEKMPAKPSKNTHKKTKKN